MPTPSRIALSLVGSAVLLVGLTVANGSPGYGERRAACILVPGVADLPALATPPLPSEQASVLTFPIQGGVEKGATSAVLWQDVYGEQHIAVDPTDALRNQLERNRFIQQAQACATS